MTDESAVYCDMFIFEGAAESAAQRPYCTFRWHGPRFGCEMLNEVQDESACNGSEQMRGLQAYQCCGNTAFSKLSSVVSRYVSASVASVALLVSSAFLSLRSCVHKCFL